MIITFLSATLSSIWESSISIMRAWMVGYAMQKPEKLEISSVPSSSPRQIGKGKAPAFDVSECWDRRAGVSAVL